MVLRFSGEAEKGKERGVDWLQKDFLRWQEVVVMFVVRCGRRCVCYNLRILPPRDVAAINVTDVTLIEEFVFSAAFSTFDQVGVDVDGCSAPLYRM
jgi:hypothetical protein